MNLADKTIPLGYSDDMKKMLVSLIEKRIEILAG